MGKPLILLSRVRDGFRSWYRQSRFYVHHWSENENVFHCTVHKSASQWIRKIASDDRVYRYSGLASYQYTQQMPGGFDPRKITERAFEKPFPARTFVTPVYIDYDNFKRIPKPRKYRAFFVMRDPRDVLISWYFSSKFSHALTGDLEKTRQELQRLDAGDGLLYGIDHLESRGVFRAQRSWAGASNKDSNVMLLKYEQLIGPNSATLFRQLLNYCDIRTPGNQLHDVLMTYSFEGLSGRQRGQEDPKAHYRKGVPGDWENYFSDKIQSRFMEASGDLLAVWQYAH